MAFTETRLKDLHNTNDIKDASSEFQIIFQNQSNDFLSFAICVNFDQAVVPSDKTLPRSKWLFSGSEQRENKR